MVTSAVGTFAARELGEQLERSGAPRHVHPQPLGDVVGQRLDDLGHGQLGAVLLQHDRRVLEPAADEGERLLSGPQAAEAGEQGDLGRHPLRLGVDEGAVHVPEHGGGSGGHEGPR